MKGERRHELQQNDLLIWVNNVVLAVKPHVATILAVVLLVVVATVGWTMWQKTRNIESAGSWDRLYAAVASGQPSVVDGVASERPGSDVSCWASVMAGDMYLGQGCQQLFTSKATAGQDLRKAVDQYRTVLKASRNSVLRERASFGLGRAYESLAGTRQSQGELQEAIKSYKEVVENWPDGAYAGMAKQRLDDLQRKDTLAFYDQFAQFDPQPEYTPLPPGDAGPKFDLDALDDNMVPDFSKALNLDLDGMDSTPEPDSPPESAPATDSADPPEAATDSPQPAAEDAPADPAS